MNMLWTKYRRGIKLMQQQIKVPISVCICLYTVNAVYLEKMRQLFVKKNGNFYAILPKIAIFCQIKSGPSCAITSTNYWP